MAASRVSLSLLAMLAGSELVQSEPIPDYALKYAPYTHLYSGESWWPSDISTHLQNTIPEANSTVLGPAGSATVKNLDTYPSNDVYLTSKDNVLDNPAWLLSTDNKPDSNGYSKAPATLIAVDKGNGTVDVFYFYFYSYNHGNEYAGPLHPQALLDTTANDLPASLTKPTATTSVTGSTPWCDTSMELPHTFISPHTMAGERITTRFSSKRTVVQQPTSLLGPMRTTQPPASRITTCHSACFMTQRTRGLSGMLRRTIEGKAVSTRPEDMRFKSDFLRVRFWFDNSTQTFSSAGGKSTGGEEQSSEGADWLKWLGYWGDEQYPDTDPRQYCILDIECAFVSGPTGPLAKNLGRTAVCQNESDCKIQDSL